MFDIITAFPVSGIWKVETLSKIKTFLWRCAHNNIEVKVCLERRGITQDIMCSICQGGSETILHALRDCNQLKCVWNQLGISFSNHDFWRSDLQSWLSFNGRMMSNLCATQPPWKVVFPIVIWNVWKSRNNTVFNKKKRNPSLAMEIVKQALEYYHCVASLRLQTCKVLKGIWWERPPQGWMKLNIDGSAKGNPDLVGCGGVIRDDSGQWIVGFSKHALASPVALLQNYGGLGRVLSCAAILMFLLLRLSWMPKLLWTFWTSQIMWIILFLLFWTTAGC